MIPPAALGADIDKLTLLDGGPLQAMHQAIGGRLKLGFPEKKFIHHVFPAKPGKVMWTKFTQRLPAVGYAFIAVMPDPKAGRIFRGVAEWSVFVANKNPFAEAALAGDAEMPGLLPMSQMALGIFQGWTIPRVGPVSVAHVGNGSAEEWPDEQLGIVVVTLGVPFELVDERAVAALDDFETIAARWPIPDLHIERITVDTIREG